MNSCFLRVVFLPLMSLALACSSTPATGQEGSSDRAVQEELVWSNLLSTIAGDRYQLLVIEDSANLLVPDVYDRQLMLEQLTELREETMESFARANAVPRVMPHFTTIGVAVEHVGAEDLATFGRAADPNEFHRWRGGAFDNPALGLACDFTSALPVDFSGQNLGFRCCGNPLP